MVQQGKKSYSYRARRQADWIFSGVRLASDMNLGANSVCGLQSIVAMITEDESGDLSEYAIFIFNIECNDDNVDLELVVSPNGNVDYNKVLDIGLWNPFQVRKS